jgi:hypothetical protein
MLTLAIRQLPERKADSCGYRRPTTGCPWSGTPGLVDAAAAVSSCPLSSCCSGITGWGVQVELDGGPRLHICDSYLERIFLKHGRGKFEILSLTALEKFAK